jgi:ankyrin repeat protein
MDSRSPISEQLNTAIEEGNMENIRAILSQRDHNGVTDDDILHAFCIIGYPGIHQRFEHPLEACATLYAGFSESGKEMRSPSTEKMIGWSPLHSAAWYGRKDIVTWLVLEKGNDVNRQDDRGQTPLSVAAEPLNNGGADDFDNICKLLLENGALPNSVDSHGRTPLDAAVNCSKNDVIRLLLEDYHVVPTKNAIYHAICFFQEDLLSLLLQHVVVWSMVLMRTMVII